MVTRVLLYELNEVPWEVFDRYVEARPASRTQRLLASSMLRTTRDDDPALLMPWRTWPTFHRSLLTEDHGALDLGQDPASFRGTPIWDVVDAAGRPVGVFGALQSWPARAFRSGGFYVPDSFARSNETFPPALERFQAFNVGMTKENGFSAEAPFTPARVASTAVDLVRRGLTPWSCAELARHVIREHRDRRHLASRPIAQVLPCFDLFWRLHRRTDPALSIFFTNHVASMMHRFWGDWMPGYDSNGYQPDPVYAEFIVRAMDYVDHEIGIMRSWVDRHPGAMLIIAGSMGQGPIPYVPMPASYVLEDADRLTGALGIGPAELGLAMYPVVTLLFQSRQRAEEVLPVVQSVRTDAGPMFFGFRTHERTISFHISPNDDRDTLPEQVTWTDVAGRQRTGLIGELGIVVRRRAGGGNTAQHTPEGVFIAYGSGIDPDDSRAEVDILDAAPSILDLLGIDPSPDMQGRPSIFAPAGSRPSSTA